MNNVMVFVAVFFALLIGFVVGSSIWLLSSFWRFFIVFLLGIALTWLALSRPSERGTRRGKYDSSD